MKYEINDIIKFTNGEYLVLDVLKHKRIYYLFLINNSEFENDTSIIKVVDDQFMYIKDDKEFKFIINKFFINAKEDILKIVA